MGTDHKGNLIANNAKAKSNAERMGAGLAGAITGAMDKMMRAKSPEDQAIYDDDQSAYLVGEIGKNLEAGGAKRIK